MPASLDRQINHGHDDARERGNLIDFYLSQPTVQVTRYTSGSSRYHVGLIFDDIQIPQGATISAAYIEVNVDDISYDDPYLKIYAEKVLNPQTYFERQEIWYRDRTSAEVPWAAGSIGIGWKQSPEIKAIIQEIVDQGAWSPGNSLNIIMLGDTGDSKTIRFHAYEGNPTLAAKLHIEWQLSTPTVATNPADNVDHDQATLHGTLTDDGGEACEVRFQYGKTTGYGTDTEWQEGKVSEDTFQQLITGLDPDQTYHFRAQAKNSEGTSSGSDNDFKTSILPPAYGAMKKAQITHPALKRVRIIQHGQQVAKFDQLSNPDEQYIESGLTVQIPTPSTVEVTTLAGQVYEFNIPEK